jgi:hypothetical protein
VFDMRLVISAALSLAVLGFAAPSVAGSGGASSMRTEESSSSWSTREFSRSQDCDCTGGGEVALPMSFFADAGGVGGFAESFDEGGGGGAFVVAGAGAGAEAFASASARASVQIRFSSRGHGGHPPSHHGGSGCK